MGVVQLNTKDVVTLTTSVLQPSNVQILKQIGLFMDFFVHVLFHFGLKIGKITILTRKKLT